VTVIDASSLAAYTLREEHWEGVEAVLRAGASSVELLPLEVTNAVLSARRAKRVSAGEAEVSIQLVHRLCQSSVRLHPHTPLLLEAKEIAERYFLTVYDAAYLALAHRERTSLATRDRAQIDGARKQGLRVLEV
jgi:predicted nucleic acid-binding protein